MMIIATYFQGFIKVRENLASKRQKEDYAYFFNSQQR
jgi:hypothetical protein